MATIEDLRAAALALPEAVEMPHFGAPSFRVKGRIFAQLAVKDLESDGPKRAILKLPEDRRLMLCEVELDGVEPDRLDELVTDSWRMVASKRLTR
ncbi:MAG: hypothetical protein ACK5SX_15795 [Sandaracinobacter sp.]